MECISVRIRAHKQQIQHQKNGEIKEGKHLDICWKGHFTVIQLHKFYSDNVHVVERGEQIYIGWTGDTLRHRMTVH